MKKYIILLTCALVCTTTLYARDTCGTVDSIITVRRPNKEWSAVLGFIAGSATAQSIVLL